MIEVSQDDFPLPPVSRRTMASDFDDDVFPPPTRKRKGIAISKTQLPASKNLSSTVSPSEREESPIAGPAKKKKRNPHPNTAYYEVEVLPLLQKVQKAWACHYLTKFSSNDLDKVIAPFWDNSESLQKDWEMGEARHKCLEHAKTWKWKALKSMKVSKYLFIYIFHLSIVCLTMDIDRNMSSRR